MQTATTETGYFQTAATKLVFPDFADRGSVSAIGTTEGQLTATGATKVKQLVGHGLKRKRRGRKLRKPQLAQLKKN